MSISADKRKIADLLLGNNIDDVLMWASSARNAQRILLSLAYDTDENIRRCSIEAIGKLSETTAQNDIEKVRDLIRRQFWLMNDESGGVGWYSPDIIGEILVNVPSLIDEFANLLLAYLKEEPFERGAHRAILKVASINPEPFRNHASLITESLDSDNPEICACTIKILEKIK